MTGFVLRGGLVADPADGSVRPRDIVVREGRVAAASDDGAGLPVIDAGDHLVIPGLVNSHTHGHANFAKGVADRWPLELSLLNGPWLGGGRDPEAVYVSALLGAYDMITRGVTACYDLAFGFPAPDPAHIAAAAQAYHDAGLRAVVAPMVADIGFVASVPGLAARLPGPLRAQLTAPPPAPEAILSRLEDVFALPMPAGVTLGLAPTIPHQCSAEFLTGCAALARAHGAPLHMHVAESRLQAEIARELWGMSPIGRLEELGVLGPDFIAAHAVWLGRDDFDALARHGAGVAHIPASNYRLGSGVAPLRAMLDAGVRVGLATDGANSSDGLSMFEAMRLANHSSRIFGLPRDEWVDAATTFRLATLGGADLIAPGAPAGFAPGAPADILCLTLDHVSFWPLNAPVTQLVTAETGSALRHVFAAGRQIMRDGVCLTIDAAQLRQRIARLAPRLAERTGAARSLAASAEPHVLSFVNERLSRPAADSRYIEAPK